MGAVLLMLHLLHPQKTKSFSHTHHCRGQARRLLTIVPGVITCSCPLHIPPKWGHEPIVHAAELVHLSQVTAQDNGTSCSPGLCSQQVALWTWQPGSLLAVTTSAFPTCLLGPNLPLDYLRWSLRQISYPSQCGVGLF